MGEEDAQAATNAENVDPLALLDPKEEIFSDTESFEDDAEEEKTDVAPATTASQIVALEKVVTTATATMVQKLITVSESSTITSCNANATTFITSSLSAANNTDSGK